MQLDVRATFLALHDSPDGGERALSLHSNFEGALAGWTVGSRLSPIWRLHNGKNAQGSVTFGDCQISFVGPVQPARLAQDVRGIEDAASIWATLGCFNLLIQSDLTEAGRALAGRIIDWAKDSGIAYEQWTLTNGVITHVEQHVLARRESSVLPELAKYGDALKHPMTRTSYQENLVATATSLARAAAVYPPIFDEIESAAGSIGKMMEKFASGQMDLLDIQSRLLTMNAAMSRFASQAFSGIPPIRGTECHFWIHSLLGTGSANLALASVVASVQLVLGEARLPERLRQLASITTKIPDSSDLTADPALLDFELLDAVEPEGSPEKIIPLVTYFSGRDGFSSYIQALSAPLTTLAECNSLRSNLLTVTHEISHIFVQSALAELSPTPAKKRISHGHSRFWRRMQSPPTCWTRRACFFWKQSCPWRPKLGPRKRPMARKNWKASSRASSNGRDRRPKKSWSTPSTSNISMPAIRNTTSAISGILGAPSQASAIASRNI
ncbi:hypothetical protein ACFOKF_00830 [Sphingobium rhizovicinum]|uniref:Uncharacterized protein n=1 Tax=Sphingobium rhizovicinum TaxID=432308 RepID=A0ABV7NCD5_9SPHN